MTPKEHVTVTVWDVDGAEIYREEHKVFLTKPMGDLRGATFDPPLPGVTKGQTIAISRPSLAPAGDNP